MQEGIFVDGQRVGQFRVLNSAGEMYKVIFENKIITRSQFFDPEEGYLKIDLHFNLDGEQHGKCTEYFDENKVQKEDVWLKGKRQSSVYYDKKGKKLGEIEVRNSKPYQGSEVIYDDDGNYKKTIEYANGKKV